MLYIYVLAAGLGLCWGSFINALVWRLHKQLSKKTKAGGEYSILRGRSMCPKCHHQLSAIDLVPVFSWLQLGGKCRYCKAPISAQYPGVELLTSGLFVLSLACWPYGLSGVGLLRFVVWLAGLVILIALLVYDWHWQILPNRLTYLFIALAATQTVIIVIVKHDLGFGLQALLGALVGGGIFQLIFSLSDGKFIGGGDVKLGYGFGLLLASPFLSWVVITVASVSGSIISAGLMLSHRANRHSKIAFGPFLIIGVIVAMLWGVVWRRALGF